MDGGDMGICVHVRSRFTALLNSGFEVSKQKQKFVFGMDSLGSIPRYLLEKIRIEREKTHTERGRERDSVPYFF
jgi:hypothetical protein